MNRPNNLYKFSQKSVLFLTCAAVLVFILNNFAISAQTKKPFTNLGEILSKLAFTSNISKSKE